MTVLLSLSSCAGLDGEMSRRRGAVKWERLALLPQASFIAAPKFCALHLALQSPSFIHPACHAIQRERKGCGQGKVVMVPFRFRVGLQEGRRGYIAFDSGWQWLSNAVRSLRAFSATIPAHFLPSLPHWKAYEG